jgi:hypothetical protein
MSFRRRWLVAVLAAVCGPAALPALASADSFPLVGWWPLNEGRGQVVRDWSLHGNDGYLGTSPQADAADPAWIPGVWLGSALRFDGNDTVTIPDAPSLEPANLTVSAWFRGTGSPGQFKQIVSKGAANGCNNGSYGLYTGFEGGISFYIANAAGDFANSPNAPSTVWDGKWHNAAGTFDGSTVRLYIDGKQVGNGLPSAIQVGYNPPAGGSNIGDYADPSCGLALKGDVDGVQIWSKALPVDLIWKTIQSLFSAAR